ncbi:MAG: hypothetical protein CSYNP_01451 [Syntrophus sp. SKADARSKE-3]|nr:hypothetical protein [Syntrophus sp. SKADARSKE-3]
MLKKYRYSLISGPINYLLCFIVRLYSRTFQMTIENEELWLDYLKQGGKVLLCVWHQQFFSAIRHFRTYEPYNPSLMISKSNDGDIIARIAEAQGWHTVRGSSSRDGGTAMKEVIQRLKLTGLAGHIVDGPRGPAGIVKAGVISIARNAGAVVVPFYTSADRAWYINSWDRFMIPKPFARVTLHFDNMINVPVEEDDQCFERQRQQLEITMQPYLLSADTAEVTTP